jgi:hypothetical protein
MSALGVPGRKNLTLLVGIVVMLVTQPLAAHRSLAAGAIFDAAFAAMCLYVLYVVFRAGWPRRIAFGLFLPVLAASVGHYVLPLHDRVWMDTVFHCFTVLFLAFAVAVILREIFARRVIRGDDVLGAFLGYLLAALVWAHLYQLTYALAPEAFNVKPETLPRLGEWHGRRALFEYLSFTTMTSLGFADISPAGPPVYSLVWLEVMFGQFYMAVVVAQLVGLKLAEAIRKERPDHEAGRDA